MAEKSSFFNSIGRDRTYKAEDWAAYFATFLSNGVFPNPANQLQVLSGTGMTVMLQPGAAFINGYRYKNDSELALTLQVAPATLNRVDRVVVRWDRTERRMYAAIVRGDEATNPVGKELTRDADFYELCLAEITVEAGVTEITQSKIKDTRQIKELCGLVGWMLDDIDFTGLFAQYDGALQDFQTAIRERVEAWLEDLESLTSEELDQTAAPVGWVVENYQTKKITDADNHFEQNTVEGALRELGAFMRQSKIGAPIVEVTGDKTLMLSDAGSFQAVVVDNMDAMVTITIPADADVAFATATELEICQLGVSPVVIAPAEGVTIVSTGDARQIADKNGSATLKKLMANVWHLGGALA